MASPNLCTITGNVRNLLGQAVQNCTVSVSVVAPFIYPATGSLIAGQLGSVTTTSTGDFSIAVVETQTGGTQAKFTFTYSDGVSTNKSKSFTVTVPNIASSTFQNLLTITSPPTTLPTFPASQITVSPVTNLSSLNAQSAFAEIEGKIDTNTANIALLAPIASPTFTGTVTAPAFSGPLTGNVTGNVSGSAASFTGSLSGDVTGTQSVTAISAATVTGKALTGFVSGAGTVSATDTILSAIDKLDGNIALKAPIASPTFTGTVTSPAFSGPLTGNVTGNVSGSAASFTGSLVGDVSGTQGATVIGANKVTNSQLAQIATQTFKGRTSASTGNVEDLTATQATAILNAMVGDSGSGGTKGLVPAPASGDASAGKFLKANGAWAVPASSSTLTVVSKTANYTATLSDDLILCNSTTGAFTITLPAAASSTGKVLRFGKTDSSANAVTIDANASETIDGALTRTLNTQYATVTIVCDGVGWEVVAFTDSVSASYYVSAATQTPGANTQINYDTKIYDSHNAVTTGAGAWKFTAPVSGTFSVKEISSFNSGTVGYIQLWKNGVAYEYLQGINSSMANASASADIKLLATEYIDIRTTAATVLSGSSAPYQTKIDIVRVGNY